MLSQSALEQLNIPGWEDIYREMAKIVDAAKSEHEISDGATESENEQKRPRIPQIVLRGNPGTGKTTAARLFGRVLYEAGILKTDKVIEVTRADMVKPYIGQTEETMHRLIEDAEEGVLFIDEAHQLVTGTENSNVTGFEKSIIDSLIELMTPDNPNHHVCVVLAGYPNGMNKLIECNDGIARRITNDITIVDSAHKSTSAEDLSDAEKESREKRLQECLEELENLTGLKGAKSKVKGLINRIKLNELREAQGLEPDLVDGLNLVFTGNPGTGKTTVARLIGKICYLMGFLSQDKFVEVHREDLVGEYIGQTTEKTRACIEKAMGGVLFIDEAYTLLQGNDEISFGADAINTILYEARNHRDICLILAGYPKEMERFIEVNPALRCIFRSVISFDDYSIDELMEIFTKMISKMEYKCTDDAVDKVKNYLERKSLKPNFGNARAVRNLCETITENFSNRIYKEMSSGRDVNNVELLQTIIAEDIPD